MSSFSLADTVGWVAGNLRQIADVTSVDVIGDQLLRVARQEYGPFVVGIVSSLCVDRNTISPLVKSGMELDIIANVPREAYWTGAAIKLAQDHNIATGTYGDILRAMRLPDVREFRSPETVFIERGLRQHDRVSQFERVHDRIYRISRDGLPDLTVAMLNEYQLTADHLRTARDRYGKFAVAVITNPNGRSTRAAEQVARDLGVEILDWGTFYGYLNRR